MQFSFTATTKLKFPSRDSRERCYVYNVTSLPPQYPSPEKKPTNKYKIMNTYDW